MSVQLRGIHSSPAAQQSSQIERARSRDGEGRKNFAALLEQEATATPSSVNRRPGTPSTPTVALTDGSGRTLPTGTTTDGETAPNLAAEGNEVTSTGTLSDNPRTSGMYIPPDFYHGGAYSPVFDHQDESGSWVPTPRFEGQKIYGPWRASLPPDFNPNARVVHDPLLNEQGPNWWKLDENGNWVKRETGYGGIPLDDDGKPIFTPDPLLFPEYYVAGDQTEDL